MTTYATPGLNALTRIAAGSVCAPFAVLNAVSILAVVELARRRLFVPIVEKFVNLTDEQTEGTAAYYLNRYTPPFIKKIGELQEIDVVTALALSFLISNIGWTVTEYFLKASSSLNKALQFLGPVQLNESYVHPLVAFIKKYTD